MKGYTALGFHNATILYKIKIENYTDNTISDVKIKLDIPRNTFLTEEDMKTISLVRKGDAKTATFSLWPKGKRSCIEIGGKVVYYDNKADDYREAELKPRKCNISCPTLKVTRIDEHDWRLATSNLVHYEETTESVPISAEGLFDIANDVIRDMNLYMLEPKESKGHNLFRGMTLFYAEDVKGSRFATKLEVLGGSKKSKLILRAYAENDEMLVGFYHTLLDEIQKRTNIKNYIEEATVIQHIGEYVAGSKTTIRDSVVQRSQIGSGAPAPPPPPGQLGSSAGEVTIQDSVVQRSQIGGGVSPAALDRYREALQRAWKDGQVDDDERFFLESMRETYGISDEMHLELEREIQSRLF